MVLKALWIIWLIITFFISFVVHYLIFAASGFEGIAILLGVFWLTYLAGLWFEKTRITDTAWAMLHGHAIGCIRLLDLIPNQQQYANWLKHVPKPIVGSLALLFITIFTGVLPLIAESIIATHKARNRILGRDY